MQRQRDDYVKTCAVGLDRGSVDVVGLFGVPFTTQLGCFAVVASTSE